MNMMFLRMNVNVSPICSFIIPIKAIDMLKVNIQYPATMPIFSLESLSDHFVKCQ